MPSVVTSLCICGAGGSESIGRLVHKPHNSDVTPDADASRGSVGPALRFRTILARNRGLFLATEISLETIKRLKSSKVLNALVVMNFYQGRVQDAHF